MNPYDLLRGTEIANGTASWGEDRVMLYAVGVGAGLQDPADELQFTTENTPGQPLQVIPGFLTTLDVPRKDWPRKLGWDGPGGGVSLVMPASVPRRDPRGGQLPWRP